MFSLHFNFACFGYLSQKFSASNKLSCSCRKRSILLMLTVEKSPFVLKICIPYFYSSEAAILNIICDSFL